MKTTTPVIVRSAPAKGAVQPSHKRMKPVDWLTAWSFNMLMIGLFVSLLYIFLMALFL